MGQVSEKELSVLNDLDQALEIIRQNDNPKEGLESLYNLDSEQSEYILDMKVRRLNNIVFGIFVVCFLFLVYMQYMRLSILRQIFKSF